MREHKLRKTTAFFSGLCILIGLLHMLGFTYCIMQFSGGGTVDPDTYTSTNKIVTRLIEGLAFFAFGITGLLIAEQRKNEDADAAFKQNLLSLLEQVQKDQTQQTTLNQANMEKLSKSIHTLQSQAGRKKK
ncbi:hypothetical protein COL39_13050 [Bacillus cereus]|uniref:hypothetical protein n=1 Tax=Bacillus cereus TaxID=1396 RepID=UPI000BF7F650|nr:hypothetical protein [Bacillus cereus]PFX73756.1 hypothetical protein COL39_13050 [Bacillus cereus]